MNLGEQLASRWAGFVEGLAENIGAVIWGAVSIVLILIGAKLVITLLSRLIRRMKDKRGSRETPAQHARVDTVLTLLHSVMRYAIYIIAGGMILSNLGLSSAVNALIATAGVGGIIIGFGVQSLVKDVVTGFFLIFENQYAVGDFVQLDGQEGTVEAMAMRVTYLRAPKGEQIIVPNGSVGRVVNYTRGSSLATVDVNIAYEEDVDKAIAVLQQVAEEYCDSQQDIVEDCPSVLGVAALGNSGVTIRTICRTKPRQHFGLERELLKRFKAALEENGIEIPYDKQVVILHSAEGTG